MAGICCFQSGTPEKSGDEYLRRVAVNVLVKVVDELKPERDRDADRNAFHLLRKQTPAKATRAGRSDVLDILNMCVKDDALEIRQPATLKLIELAEAGDPDAMQAVLG